MLIDYADFPTCQDEVVSGQGRGLWTATGLADTRPQEDHGICREGPASNKKLSQNGQGLSPSAQPF